MPRLFLSSSSVPLGLDLSGIRVCPGMTVCTRGKKKGGGGGFAFVSMQAWCNNGITSYFLFTQQKSLLMWTQRAVTPNHYCKVCPNTLKRQIISRPLITQMEHFQNPSGKEPVQCKGTTSAELSGFQIQAEPIMIVATSQDATARAPLRCKEPHVTTQWLASTHCDG